MIFWSDSMREFTKPNFVRIKLISKKGAKMDYKVRPTNLDKLPKWSFPDSKLYEEIGEEGFIKLFDVFYDTIAESDIANFFPQDRAELAKIKAHNVKFFIEVSGGQPIYSQENGHVDMVKMHEPFSIPEKARVEWLGCLKEVLSSVEASEDAKQSFWDYCESFSSHLVNSAPHQTKYQELVNDRW